MKINKQEFVKDVAEKAGITIKDADSVIEATEAVILKYLMFGDSFKFAEMKFSVGDTAPRKFVNVRTGVESKSVSRKKVKVSHSVKLNEMFKQEKTP